MRMKYIGYVGIALLALLGLSNCTTKNLTPENSGSGVGLANPASEYCIAQGGKLEIRTSDDGGQYGMCIFPDGTEIEEWEYYRSSQK